jgi:hypothetical protein
MKKQGDKFTCTKGYDFSFLTYGLDEKGHRVSDGLEPKKNHGWCAV